MKNDLYMNSGHNMFYMHIIDTLPYLHYLRLTTAGF